MSRTLYTNVGVNTLQRTITTAEHQRLMSEKDRQVERLSNQVLRLRAELAQARLERDVWQKKASEVPF